MRYPLILLCILFVVPSAAVAQDVFGPPPPPAAPELFCAEPDWKWDGTVVAGETVEHAFALVNRGLGELRIENVRLGCGCQAVRHDKTIAPGATGQVVIQMRTANQSRFTTKKAIVYTNDPKNDKLTLSMGGEISPLFTFEPPYPTLEGLRGEVLVTAVKLKRALPGAFELVGLKAASGSSLGHTLTETKPGEEYTVELRLEPDESKKGRLVTTENLDIEVRYEGREATIPLTSRVKYVDTVTPSLQYLSFQRGELAGFYARGGAPPERSIMLRGWEGREFAVTSVELRPKKFSVARLSSNDPPPLAIAFEKGVRKSAHEIRATVQKHENTDRRRVAYGELVIRTDDAATPEITIPTTVYFPL